MATRVRSVYIHERRRAEQLRTGDNSRYSPGPYWDGGECRLRNGRMVKRKSQWPQIAKFMLEKGVDPDIYIRQVFRLALHHGKLPMPNHLSSDWLFQLFKAWWPHYSEEIRTAFIYQQGYARGELASFAEAVEFTPEQRWCWLLLDDRAPMSSLFRYCLAVSENLLPIARRYHDGALQQYMSSPQEFDKHWGDWIPARLKKQARLVRQYALTGDQEK